jgi:hypothetical protein
MTIERLNPAYEIMEIPNFYHLRMLLVLWVAFGGKGDRQQNRGAPIAGTCRDSLVVRRIR